MSREPFSARDLVRATLQERPEATHTKEQRMAALDEAARASGRLLIFSRCGPVLGGYDYCLEGHETGQFGRPGEALLAAAQEEEAERAAQR